MMNFSPLSSVVFSLITNNAIAWVVRPHPQDSDGIQYEIIYPNGYGVSIVKFFRSFDFKSYGVEEDLWELAVLKDGRLCYDTPITNDVCGYLTEKEVVLLCEDVYYLEDN